RTLDAPLDRNERLAILAGFTSHVALDLSMHPLVNYIARRDTRLQGGAESHHHRLAEKFHAQFYHLDSTGHDLIGSRQIGEKARVTKRSSLVRRVAEPAIIDLTVSAYRAMWSDAPGRREVAGWVRSFAQFGRMVGGPLALRNSLLQRTPANR